MSSVVVYGAQRGVKRKAGPRRYRFGRNPLYGRRRTSMARYATARRATRYGHSLAMRNLRTGGLLGIEKKFLDCNLSSTAFAAPTNATGGEFPPTAGSTGCYSAPAQGDGPTNRDGNKIVIVQMDWKGTISCASQADQTAADITTFVLLAMVQDTQTNGAQLNSEDVFSNPAAGASTATDVFRNMSYTRRFKILAMTRKKLSMPTLTWDGTNIEQTGFHLPISLSWRGKIPVTFTTASTTADIANVTDNSIQLVGFCTNTSLAPLLSGNMRMRFYG